MVLSSSAKKKKTYLFVYLFVPATQPEQVYTLAAYENVLKQTVQRLLLLFLSAQHSVAITITITIFTAGSSDCATRTTDAYQAERAGPELAITAIQMRHTLVDKELAARIAALADVQPPLKVPSSV